MKRILITIITVLLMSPAIAQDKGLSNAVTMVSYEQGWLDSRGTLALKNNTNEGIHNVSFQITYLDMSGNPLDYEVYTKDIETEPCPQDQQDSKQAYQSCRCVIEAVISSTFEDVVIIVVFFLLQRGCIVILQLKLDFE